MKNPKRVILCNIVKFCGQGNSALMKYLIFLITSNWSSNKGFILIINTVRLCPGPSKESFTFNSVDREKKMQGDILVKGVLP